MVPGNNTVYLNYYACVFYSKAKAPLILKGGKFMKIVVFRMPKMFRGFFKKIFNMDHLKIFKKLSLDLNMENKFLMI